MFKRNTLAVCILAAVLLCSYLVSGCFIRSSSSQDNGTPYPIIETEASDINISVDPRIELLSIIEYLSPTFQKNFPEKLSSFDSSYKKDIKKYFSSYKNHEAIAFFEKLSQQYYFNTDGILSLMIYVDNDFNLSNDLMTFANNSGSSMESQTYDTLSTIVTSCDGIQNIQSLMQYLQSFAKDTNFLAFFESHKDYYQSIVDSVAALIRSDDKSYLENYIGSSQNSYNIIAAPLLQNEPIGTCTSSSYALNLYEIFGPASEDAFSDRDRIRDLTWYEFGRSFIQPLTTLNHKEVVAYQDSFAGIEDAMKKNGCDNWQSAVTEHINRAVVARLIYRQCGVDAYNAFLQQQRDAGFCYIDSLTRYLIFFEQHRSLYHTFASFFPDLTKAFASVDAIPDLPVKKQTSVSDPRSQKAAPAAQQQNTIPEQAQQNANFSGVHTQQANSADSVSSEPADTPSVVTPSQVQVENTIPPQAQHQ